MSTASLTGSHSETTPTQEKDGSLSLDHNAHSQSRFQRHPETNYTGPPPSYNDSINNESYYSVQTYQPQSYDTRFDGSHSETEHSQKREKSNYLDSNVHSQSGVELHPVISYSQEPRHELHLAYEPRYDGVHTQQPQQQSHDTRFDGSHSETEHSQKREKSNYLDSNVHSQSGVELHPVISYSQEPRHELHLAYEPRYDGVHTQQPQQQSHDTRFDGSHSETEHSQKREKSNYLDSNVHSQSGVELHPVISYSQEPRHELHLAYEPRYDGVHTQQPQQQSHEHLSNSVDKSHDHTCKDRAEDCLDSSSECDCEDCCENFLACLDICEICISCFRVCSDDD
ncbi:hypothetical protein Bpfe_028338 [Biomphalaria pfeifferi]|uniref:Uncharacterized protein n=1 Tax=Biomphalaria pfeifferi TaxID=112525 RepID=A0AAD8EWP1_BIOPF|nr:hypothetical protein Bpfe_028338 [Biomphalaria pfeifferi]